MDEYNIMYWTLFNSDVGLDMPSHPAAAPGFRVM